jgi:hypothetical protein
MLSEMKDSGLQSRDRASLVRQGAGVGRTDSSDSLSQVGSFGSDGGKDSMIEREGRRGRKKERANHK